MTDAAAYANQFATAFKKVAALGAQEKSKILGKVDQLKAQRQELDDKIRELDKELKGLDENIWVGIRHAANDAGISIDQIKSKIARNSGHTPARASRADMQEAVEAVQLHLPPADGLFIPASDIATAAGLDRDRVKAALTRLLREGVAENNHKRGSAGGWRQANGTS